MDKENAVELNKISMRFNMSRDRVDSVKEYVVKLIKHQLFFEEFWALKDISFSVKKGEVFGLIGLNGAGKSTLLKIIAGVLTPTTGTVSVSGKIAPLLELGSGFDPELTAKENVFMNGAVLGHSEQFMKERYNDIMDFAELWEFENVPIKNFSSGMYARLGFSIATMVKPDILIVDEILGVGDYKFQKKSSNRISELMSDGTTVLLVSHSTETIKHFCSRVALLENGQLIEVGNAEQVCNHYESR